MSKDVFDMIPPQQRPPEVHSLVTHRFRAAGGQELKVVGHYAVECSIGRKRVTHPIFVIQGLNEPLILGIDFIGTHELTYCPTQRSFKWKGESVWDNGVLKVQAVTMLGPLSAQVCKVQLQTECGAKPAPGTKMVVTIQHPEVPTLTGGPYLVEADEEGSTRVVVYNCAPTPFTLGEKEFIGHAENVDDREMEEINPRYIQALA